MDIKEFITASLEQIADGTKNAQKVVASAGGYVNPAMCGMVEPDGNYFGRFDSHHHVFLVDFDIAVTVLDESKAEGGAKLKIAGVLSVGGTGGAASSSETTSRLKFKVPIALPVDAESSSRAERQRQEEDEKVQAFNQGRGD